MDDKPIVLVLYEQSGNMARAWAEEGYDVVAVDIEAEERVETVEGGGEITFVAEDIRSWLPPRREYAFVAAFPPCTNLAVSGARWFKNKGLDGLSEGIELVERARYIAEWADAPWMIENPVSTLSTYWRSPDYTFHPHEYNSFTEQDEAYTKKTCLWTSDDFILPDGSPAEEYDDRIHKMPPSEERSKKRSVTPQGFANAIVEANSPKNQ
jgi:hypothetical protein